MAITSSVEREDDQKFYITLGDKQILATVALNNSEVKEWTSQIVKLNWNKNNKKNRKLPPLVVGLWAERNIYYPDGRHNYHPKKAKMYHKMAPYDLLVLCVDDQCLLWQFNVEARDCYTLKKGYIPDQVPKALKEFLCNNQIIVVGLGIDAMVKKLESDTDLLIPEKLELRDLVQEKLGKTPGEFAKSNLEKLAKLIMGPEMEVVKPESMTWWKDEGYYYHDKLSSELVQFASTHAYLVSEMANNLFET